MYDPMNQIVAIDDNNDTSATIQPIDDNHHTHIIHYEDTNDDVNEDGSTDNRVYVSGPINMATQALDDSSQLTLSFRGQVYVFDSVSPQKVQAVLLLLGGCEAPSGSQGVEGPPLDQRGVQEYPKCSQSQRAASLVRFRQKRKERCFDKKVRYIVRQDVALRMQRNKGQFTSAKKQDGSNGWGADQESEQDVQSETSCTHCGISSKSTPMMRKGPSGPRTLCNACGLFWANRGTLRDISKRNQERPLAPPEQVGEANNNLDCGTPIPAHNSLVTFTDDNKPAAMVSDH
ncbi:PREDICTED: GATA transcription factor 25-like isoform X1 [Lupinus angustifolius]|uniref:GATA transcription factor 25-like isoform X1 n=1 Tax=Lupinus angustifolius TaxID=3871 RepID=UPI00092F655A|nr:PREDICTED: GATA transcription factor 25-like isoform X1 [Lupinus angustifolius]